MQFPIQNAALFLKGKPPEELPHGLLEVPPEVRQLIEEQRAKYPPEALGKCPPEALAKAELAQMNLETIGWYFDGLNMQVLYRETPQGPEVLAVGHDEVFAFKQRVPYDERKELKTFHGVAVYMSRLIVPISHKTLWNTGDEMLWLELKLWLRTGAGAFADYDFYVDSGATITTFPAYEAKLLGLVVPARPVKVQHMQAGLEVRSGMLRFRIDGMDQTEYAVSCLLLGDPNVPLNPNAPIGTVPRSLLQPLALLEKLRFTMEKDPTAGQPFNYGQLVIEKV